MAERPADRTRPDGVPSQGGDVDTRLFPDPSVLDVTRVFEEAPAETAGSHPSAPPTTVLPAAQAQPGAAVSTAPPQAPRLPPTTPPPPRPVPARGDGGGPGQPGGESGGDEQGKHRGPLGFLRELPVLIVVAFLLALLIKSFLVQAFYIPSSSMEPTLLIGDRVLVNKVVYRIGDIKRGDIIVFEDPHPIPEPDKGWWSSFTHWVTDGLGVTTSPERDFIKRVIGLPGETVELKKNAVFVNGERLDEPYLPEATMNGDFAPFKVPADTLFVMGDNRSNSADSRASLGPIPMEKVVGKAFLRIWPPSRLRWMAGA